MSSNPPTLGRYELLERVGLGGMAEVYRARLPSMHGLSKTVAIKRILPYHCADPSFVKMFLDEARIALSLSHPNIGQIYELSEVDDFLFLAMEFIDGPNLSTVLKRLARTKRLLPLPLTLAIMERVCSGLHAAHEQRDDDGLSMQIIHRDVSPHNVMVGRDGCVKLIDFGIAKARDRLVQTEAGTVRGKLLYMSPEHAASRSLDHRTDIFSAGMLLLTLLNGLHIWRGMDEVQVLMEIRRWRTPRIAALRPDLQSDVQAALQKIVDRAMAFKAEDRFEDAEQMREALARLLASVAPETGSVALGRFVADVMDERLDTSEAVDEAPDEEASLDPTRQTPPGADKAVDAAAVKTTSSRMPAVKAVEQTVTRQDGLSDENTAVGPLPVGPDTPLPERHTPSLARALEEAEGLGLEDRTPIDGVRIPVGGISDGVNMPDDPVAQPPARADRTGDLKPAAILRGAVPRVAAPPEAIRRPMLLSPLLWIGATIGLLLIVLAGALAARLIFADDSEAQAEEAELARGRVLVTSTPEGAEILLDGEPMGMKTPSELELAPGDHTLGLNLGGFAPYLQVFSLQPDSALTFSVELMPEVAEAPPEPAAPVAAVEDEMEQSPTLVIYSDPEATVFIDGDQLPEPSRPDAPLEITPLSQGETYQIRLQKPGFENWEESVVLDKPRLERRVKLKRKNTGRLTVTSNLWAEVYVDGRQVARSTPLTYFPLKVGPHKIVLKNPERQLTRTVTVDIKPGETHKISVRF